MSAKKDQTKKAEATKTAPEAAPVKDKAAKANKQTGGIVQDK